MKEAPHPLGLDGVLHGILYYEDLQKKLCCCTALALLLVLIALPGLLYLSLREQKPVYFGMNQEMQILPLTPLNEPLHTDAAIAAWAAEAATAIFNLDFLHWREQLTKNRSYFTKKAYVSFRKALEDEGHIRILTQYRALMHGVPQGMPIITAQGLLNNRKTWELELPFRLAYETSEKILSQQRFTITLRIQRMSTAEYVKGIAIDQIVVGNVQRTQE